MKTALFYLTILFLLLNPTLVPAKKLAWFAGEVEYDTGEVMAATLSYSPAANVLLVREKTSIRTVPAARLRRFWFTDTRQHRIRQFTVAAVLDPHRQQRSVLMEEILPGPVTILAGLPPWFRAGWVRRRFFRFFERASDHWFVRVGDAPLQPVEVFRQQGIGGLPGPGLRHPLTGQPWRRPARTEVARWVLYYNKQSSSSFTQSSFLTQFQPQ